MSHPFDGSAFSGHATVTKSRNPPLVSFHSMNLFRSTMPVARLHLACHKPRSPGHDSSSPSVRPGKALLHPHPRDSRHSGISKAYEDCRAEEVHGYPGTRLANSGRVNRGSRHARSPDPCVSSRPEGIPVTARGSLPFRPQASRPGQGSDSGAACQAATCRSCLAGQLADAPGRGQLGRVRLGDIRPRLERAGLALRADEDLARFTTPSLLPPSRSIQWTVACQPCGFPP